MTNLTDIIDAAGRAQEFDVNFTGVWWQVVTWKHDRRIVLADGMSNRAEAVAKLTAIVADARPAKQNAPAEQIKCRHCGAPLVLVRRNGVWACDPGTKRRHACIDRWSRSK